MSEAVIRGEGAGEGVMINEGVGGLEKRRRGKQ